MMCPIILLWLMMVAVAAHDDDGGIFWGFYSKLGVLMPEKKSFLFASLSARHTVFVIVGVRDVVTSQGQKTRSYHHNLPYHDGQCTLKREMGKGND